MPMQPSQAPAQDAPNTWKRWLPLAVLAAVMGLVFAMGWHRYLSFETIGLNYDWLKTQIASNWLVAIAAFIVAYIAVVALSLPGALIMTLSGGLLFGGIAGTFASVIGATLGATLLFLIAKSSFGETLAQKAGPWLAKLRDGFRENAMSYLLFLRLVPAFPFFIVNLAPAVLGVPLKIFFIATLFGIIPATAAFTNIGAGLGSVIDAQNQSHAACLAAQPANAPTSACPYTIDTSALLTKELLAAFVLLGVVSLIPVFLKRMRGRNA
jgi:uncharacterized membrane protein YdjX (TVP38/TMEM64 family)